MKAVVDRWSREKDPGQRKHIRYLREALNVVGRDPYSDTSFQVAHGLVIRHFHSVEGLRKGCGLLDIDADKEVVDHDGTNFFTDQFANLPDRDSVSEVALHLVRILRVIRTAPSGKDSAKLYTRLRSSVMTVSSRVAWAQRFITGREPQK